MTNVLKAVAAVAVAVVLAVPATAAEKVWVGRDAGNRNIHWTCTKVGTDTWEVKKNGTLVGKYDGAGSGTGYIELQLAGVKAFDRVRVHADKLEMNREGSKTEWITMATGKWGD